MLFALHNTRMSMWFYTSEGYQADFLVVWVSIISSFSFGAFLHDYTLEGSLWGAQWGRQLDRRGLPLIDGSLPAVWATMWILFARALWCHLSLCWHHPMIICTNKKQDKKKRFRLSAVVAPNSWDYYKRYSVSFYCLESPFSQSPEVLSSMWKAAFINFFF